MGHLALGVAVYTWEHQDIDLIAVHIGLHMDFAAVAVDRTRSHSAAAVVARMDLGSFVPEIDDTEDAVDSWDDCSQRVTVVDHKLEVGIGEDVVPDRVEYSADWEECAAKEESVDHSG